MKITINVKPKVQILTNFYDFNTAKGTKQQLLNNVTSGFCRTFVNGNIGDTRMIGKSNTIRVYNLEKRRPVTAAVTDKKVLKKGIKRKVVTPGHWIAYVYDFDLDLLKLAGLVVIQGARTFTISGR